MLWTLIYCAVAVTAALGMRLLLLARSTRKLPELLIGIFFISVGPLGVLPSILPFQLEVSDEQTALLRLLGEVTFGVASSVIAAFTWRVFAPDRSWGGWLFAFFTAGEAVTIIGQQATGGFTAFGTPGPWYQANLAIELSIYAWATYEPIRHYVGGRLRVRLGLADPVLNNRILLWAIWASCTVLFMLTWIANEVMSTLRPGNATSQTAFLAAYCIVGLACSGSMWLMFFPPRIYTAWIEGREHEH